MVVWHELFGTWGKIFPDVLFQEMRYRNTEYSFIMSGTYKKACIFGRVVKEEDGVTWVSWKLNSNNKTVKQLNSWTVEQLNSYLFADYNRDKMEHVKNFYYIYIILILYIYSNSKFYHLCSLHLINCSTVQLFNCSNIALSYKYYFWKHLYKLSKR